VQVEAVAQARAWVRKAALIGRPHPELGQEAILAVEPAGPPDVPGLERALAEAGFTMDRIVLQGRLPVDPRHNTKIDYARLARTISS
jgi:hypothetical protein